MEDTAGTGRPSLYCFSVKSILMILFVTSLILSRFFELISTWLAMVLCPLSNLNLQIHNQNVLIRNIFIHCPFIGVLARLI